MSRIQAIIKKCFQFSTFKILAILIFTTILSAKVLEYFKINDKNIILLVQQIILFFPVLIALKLKKTDAIELGLKKIKPRKDILLIFKLYALYIIASIIINLLLLELNISIPGLGKQPNYAEIFKGLNLATIFIYVVILAPIFEELLFRGLIYQKITGSHINKIILSSIIFAGIHFQFEIFIPLLALGMIIGYIRYKTDSSINAIIFHALNNLITFLAIKSTF